MQQAPHPLLVLALLLLLPSLLPALPQALLATLVPLLLLSGHREVTTLLGLDRVLLAAFRTLSALSFLQVPDLNQAWICWLAIHPRRLHLNLRHHLLQ
jgi:hypothetical protein